LCEVSGSNFSKLRLAQAYMKLSRIPESENGIRMVSLDRVGNYEIRMFDEPEAGLADMPVFWLELFDCDRQSSVDSCCCHGIEAAMAALESFLLQTNRSRGL
jgi:hypothetical protein